MYLFRCGGDALGFRLLLAQFGVGARHIDACIVFTLNGGSVCLCHLDALIHIGVRFADGAVAFLLGNGFLRIVDGLCGSFAAKRGDVARLIADIGYVYVDEAKADFLELGFHVAGNRFKELVAVGVDLLNIHCSHNETQLAENDVLGKLLDGSKAQAKKPFRRVLHDALLGRDANREAGGNVYADVLAGKRVDKVYLQGHRREIQKLVCLHERPDKRCAAVNADGRFA